MLYICLNQIKLMKQDIFNQYVEKVCETFSIQRAELFLKDKRRDLSEARYMLYYLCATRPMRLIFIEKMMCENGYSITHSTILTGVKVIKKKMADDKDYVSVINDIERSVFI